MRIFLSLLVLIFNLQSWAMADDKIEDFEIQGISVGDSLLDHFTLNNIDKALQNASYYKNKRFVEIFLETEKIDFENLEKLQVAIEPNDKNFIIEKILLSRNFNNEIEKCKIFKKSFIKDNSDFLINAERIDQDTVASVDKTGNSFRYINTFLLPTGGFFNFVCTDYGKEMYDQHGWYDSFTVSIGSEKILKFLQGDAY